MTNNNALLMFPVMETASRFCSRLHGVNSQKVQKWLASRGHIIDEGRRGYRPSCHTRQRYFVLRTRQKNGHEFYECCLTAEGCRWLYGKYLAMKLPMKSDWDGRLDQNVFAKSAPIGVQAVTGLRAV